jgi:hypothetical protein
LVGNEYLSQLKISIDPKIVIIVLLQNYLRNFELNRQGERARRLWYLMKAAGLSCNLLIVDPQHFSQLKLNHGLETLLVVGFCHDDQSLHCTDPFEEDDPTYSLPPNIATVTIKEMEPVLKATHLKSLILEFNLGPEFLYPPEVLAEQIRALFPYINVVMDRNLFADRNSIKFVNEMEKAKISDFVS